MVQNVGRLVGHSGDSGMNKVNAKTLLTLGDGRHIIEPNLYLVVRSNGKNRNYVLRYTIHGRRRDMSLGSPEIKTLTTVKAEATKFKAMIASGIDPLDVKEEKTAKKNLLPSRFPLKWNGFCVINCQKNKVECLEVSLNLMIWMLR